MKRSSNGEWRSCADLGGDGGGDNQGEKVVGESRVKKVKRDEKESSIETKDKKRKSEGESLSKLKKENEELKEKLRKQGRAADKMAEEYSRLRGRLRKFKRERADLEAQIEVLKQRNKDLSTMAGSEEISQNTVKEADRKVEQKSPTNEEKETNSNVKEEHHEKSLMAEVLKLKASLKKVFGDGVVEKKEAGDGVLDRSAVDLDRKKAGAQKVDGKGSKMHEPKQEKMENQGTSMKRDEISEGLVKCEKCGKAVKQKSLIHHNRAVHLNETRFNCDMCPYKCYFSSSLKEHKKGHDRKEGAHRSMFSCKLCTFSTPVSGSFAKHMRGHEIDAKLQRENNNAS